ncbi:hypothetical protein I4F81_010873 [Pyropia yezoensis]|uniref:Uncharacterized protein n=1 Tax=Pyropia yezoensis TaxID=2788 RepID=A0ACC3CEY4_PYRYE|nr:hypothetical protein I4F81_010873 [Neopyropia yezoensis]
MKLDKEVAQASEAFALTLKSLVDLGRPMDADAYLAIVQEGKAAAGLDGWPKVEGMVKNVQTMQVLQKWLRKRKASGRALPTSRKELLVMMAAPGSGATMHMHAQRGT